MANLLDDIQIRAKVRGVTVADFTVLPPSEGPAPFDTYAYQMAVIGRYHQVGVVPDRRRLAAADHGVERREACAPRTSPRPRRSATPRR